MDISAIDWGKIIPLLVPILILQIGLQIYSLVDLSRQESVRWFNKWVWAAIIIITEIIGPILYFSLARKEQ